MMDPEKQKVEKKVSQKLGWRVLSGSGNSHRMWKEIKIPNWGKIIKYGSELHPNMNNKYY